MTTERLLRTLEVNQVLHLQYMLGPLTADWTAGHL